MTTNAKELYEEALALDEEARAELVKLLAPKGNGWASPEIEKAWMEEIERRVAAMDRGEAELVPAADVFQRLEERFSK